MLVNPIHQVEGLTLCDGSIIQDLLFADDIILFLNGSRENLQHAFHFINLLCEGFGTCLNWHKSCIVWASHNPYNWSWGEDLGLKWLGKGQAIKYLGFQMGFEVLQ